jgi:hypothetical protein
MVHSRMRLIFATAFVLLTACASAPDPNAERWWKGNLHTHSLWTDGTDFPEMIASWYRAQGYNFLAITEHDMLQEGERWVDINAPDAGWPPRNASSRAALPAYRERFGTTWIQERTDSGRHMVRLRGLSEYRDRFEQQDSFLFIMSEEITDKGGAHLNAFNLDVAIKPRGGANSAERIRSNIAAVQEHTQKSGRSIISIVNHPNYVWTLKAEEIANTPGARLFEVYNGHALVNNAGDSIHPSTEQMWDIMLTMRQQNGGGPIYGVASDDAHDYRAAGDTVSMPGRGWVMVRAAHLTPEKILSALHNGDFYASTGVTLTDVRRTASGITIAIQPQANTTYRTQFIGTRAGSTVAEVLKETTGVTARYEFQGNERYVRAKVISSRPQIDPVRGTTMGQSQTAWVQPVMR